MKVTPVTLPPGRSNDECDRTADEISREHCQSIELAVGKAVIDRQVLRFHKALLLQALGEAGCVGCVALGRGGVQVTDQRQLPRLTDGARRRQDGAAEKAGELSSPDTHASHIAFGVGWVERSETHLAAVQHGTATMGFRFRSTHPTPAHRTNARP